MFLVILVLLDELPADAYDRLSFVADLFGELCHMISAVYCIYTANFAIEIFRVHCVLEEFYRFILNEYANTQCYCYPNASLHSDSMSLLTLCSFSVVACC